MPTVRLALGERSYPIVVESGRPERLASLLHKEAGHGRVFAFLDAQFYALHGPRLLDQLKDGGIEVSEFIVPVGEKAKTPRVLEAIYNFLLGERISRGDFILACGGGVTSDLVGYAASTVLRGVEWGVVPTTLLAMVDAAIGGKTGINHRLGKNLIGAFWQPRFVWTNVDYVQTLPPREIVAGLGEILKYAGLVGAPLLGMLRRYLRGGNLYDADRLTAMIMPSVRCKAQLVSEDENDLGSRMYLNLGHTFGHAIERSLGFGRLLHGEAVIIGLLASLELGRIMNPRSGAKLAEYRSLVDVLMRKIPRITLRVDEILEDMATDKKRQHSKLRFVLLAAPARPVFCTGVRKEFIREALETTLGIYSNIGGSDAPNSRC
jgi:3-dehydroquinate synthase